MEIIRIPITAVSRFDTDGLYSLETGESFPVFVVNFGVSSGTLTWGRWGVERPVVPSDSIDCRQLQYIHGKTVTAIDSGRFVQLFAQHQRSIHAYIYSLVPSRVDADDVMQETSLVLWRKWGEFDLNRDFIRWACGIAFHEVLKLRRKAATNRCYFNEELLEQLSAEVIRQSDELVSRHVALLGCLNKLGTRDRELIERRYQAKTTARQVADDLDRPASTVYKALARIRNALFDCVQQTLAQEAHP